MSRAEMLERRRLMSVELSFGPSAQWGTSFTVGASPFDFFTPIINSGTTAATKPFNIEYRLIPVPAGTVVEHPDFNDPHAIVWGTVQIDQDVPAGGEIDLYPDLFPHAVAPGRYALVRKLDSTNVYRESNERDNFAFIGVSRYFADNTAVVDGTAGPDRITLTADVDELVETQDAIYHLTINGVSETLRGFDGITGFHIRSGNGDDVVIIRSVPKWPDILGPTPVSVEGGAGDDRIVGSFDDETLSGGSGKDTIDGNGGNDLLRGNGGNDRLFGGAGRDRLYGNNGADRLNGGSSGDRLNGGAGIDTLVGGGGKDRFFTLDGQRDELFGGSNRDRAHADAADLLESVEQQI